MVTGTEKLRVQPVQDKTYQALNLTKNYILKQRARRTLNYLEKEKLCTSKLKNLSINIYEHVENKLHTMR